MQPIRTSILSLLLVGALIATTPNTAFASVGAATSPPSADGGIVQPDDQSAEWVAYRNSNGETFILSSEPLQSASLKSIQSQPQVARQTAQTGVVAKGGGNTFPPNSPPATNWRGCGLFDSQDQFVAEYTRLRVSTSRMPAGSVATLRCGNDTYGYRHIQKGKQTAWTNMGNLVGGVPWRDLAGWSIAWSLRDPDKASFGDNKFCFSRIVYIYDSKGKLRGSKHVRTILGETGQRIITAYPADAQCGGTNLVK